MTYIDEPYYECNWCQARIYESSLENSDEDIYDHDWFALGTKDLKIDCKHYCPHCIKEHNENGWKLGEDEE